MKVWFLVKWTGNPFPEASAWKDCIGNVGLLRIEKLEDYFSYIRVLKLLPIKVGSRAPRFGIGTKNIDVVIRWYRKNRALGFPAPAPEDLPSIIGRLEANK